MSHGVHIQVTIATSHPDRLRSIALDSFSETWGEKLIDDCNSTDLVPGAIEAYEFLNDLREGKVYFKWGNEGDIVLWGMVGNHSEPLAFAKRLLPFWKLLFEPNDQIINHDWQHILIVYTHSCKDPASGVIEIGWPSDEEINTKLKFTHTEDAQFTCI